EEGPSLVLKTLGGEHHEREHAALLEAAAGHPRITVLDGRLSAGEKNALIGELDCYVSLHRSEGFGLTIAEAMALGTPVIATDYGRGRRTALDLAGVRERMATGPRAAPGAQRGARGAVRDAALRAMRPYTVHQRLVDEELLRALVTLDERVRGLAAGQQAIAA